MKRSSGGTGLGLAIVRSLVELNGGQAWVTSKGANLEAPSASACQSRLTAKLLLMLSPAQLTPGETASKAYLRC